MDANNYKEKFIVEGFDEVVLENVDDFKIVSQEKDKLRINLNGKNYDVMVKSFDKQSKKATLNVDGYDFNVTLKEPLDQLMDEMGFLKAKLETVKELKSPMPGLIRSMYVQVGEEVNEGDKLLSLEAMKMENIIKSPGLAKVKAINVRPGDAVEKNSILIEFE